MAAAASGAGGPAPAGIGSAPAGLGPAPAGKTSGVLDHKQVAQAMAMRVKYRLDPHNFKRRQPLQSMAVHMMNRGLRNIYPNGTDVRTLGLEIIASCLDYAEANHNGVAVEEVPPAVWAQGGGLKDPITKESYEGIGRYNLECCRGAAYLDTCFTDAQARAVIVGTLSHSHLLLVLLCIAAGAKWNVLDETKDDGTMKFPCDANGFLNRSALADMDPVLQQLLIEGLEMEILSYKIYLEEPFACIAISNALNRANKVALKTTELHALSTLTGAVGVCALAGELNYNSIKESVRTVLAEFVDDPEFITLFDFVCKVGADQQTYLPDFLRFTSKCVSSQHRRLRLATCALLNQLQCGPLTKMALCKRSLKAKPGPDLYCPAPEQELLKTPKDELEVLEDILFFFHTSIKNAVTTHLPEGGDVVFYGNVDVFASEAFVKEMKTSTSRSNPARRLQSYRKALVNATARYWGQLTDKGAVLPTSVSESRGPPVSWPSFKEALAERTQPGDASAPADAVEPAKPVLIRYNEFTGNSLNEGQSRDIVTAPNERFALPYRSWLKARTCGQLGVKEAAEQAVKLVLHTLHKAACTQGPIQGIDVMYDPQLRSTVVVTTQAFEQGLLSLPPCVPHKMQVRSESIHPDRVPIEVRDPREGTNIAMFYIHPEWQAPEEKVITRTEAEGSASAEHMAPHWTGKESMHPIWAVRRMTHEEFKSKGLVSNMQIEIRDMPATVVHGANTITWMVRVPFLTNPASIVTGAELLWERMPKPKKTATTRVDWVHDQKAAEKAELVANARKRKAHACDPDEI